MLLLLGFLLVPMVFGVEMKMMVNNYILKIDANNTLKSICTTSKSTNELDLSSLGLQFLEKDVFHNLDTIKTLNLANNSLQHLPSGVFAKLTNLEHLSLTDNELTHFQNTFVDLKNLKTLNIFNIPLMYLVRGSFYGLTKFTDILIPKSDHLVVFADCFEENHDSNLPKSYQRKSKKVMTAEDFIKNVEMSIMKKRETTTMDPLSIIHRVKICIQNGNLKLVEYVKKDDPLPPDCEDDLIGHLNPRLNLSQRKIKNFEKGWYRLYGKNRPAINLITINDNNITKVTSNILNDLPKSVKTVKFDRNQIQRLETDAIENHHLKFLYVNENMINEIEDNALKMMNLIALEISDNRLNDTRFAASLPSTLNTLKAKDNKIKEVTPGSFSKLNKLSDLCLNQNNITILRKDSLLGLSNLQTLDLSACHLRKIEPGAFQNTKRLRNLNLAVNSISGFDRGVFDGLDSDITIRLTFNNIVNVTNDTLPELPKNLQQLHLDNNDIENLEAGSFVNVPKKILTLSANKISRIEKGSFDLPTLEELKLSRNFLEKVDGDSFEGLDRLKVFWLAFNRINKLQKGFMKNLGRLDQLILVGNPIEKLDNGALFGSRKSPQAAQIILGKMPIKIMQGGVFDDV